MKIVITAGFDRSPSALAMAELLRRASVDVAGLVIVTPWGTRRIRSLLRRIHLRDLPGMMRKLTGKRSAGPLSRFLERSAIRPQPLSAWAAANDVDVLRTQDINSDSTLAFLRSREPHWIIYGGGGILRKEILNSGTGPVLNAHLGPLPEVRGMNAAEWSVLLGLQPVATVHLIDEGIDTGAVLNSTPIDLDAIHSVEELRQQAVVTGIEAIVRTLTTVSTGLAPPIHTHRELHRQCFTLSPALKELLETRLAMTSRRSG